MNQGDIKQIVRNMGTDIYGLFFVGGAVICFLLFLLFGFIYITWPYGFIGLALAAGAAYGLHELRKWAE